MRGWNFSAGPAAIPQEVIKEVQEELLEYNGSGASIIEAIELIFTLKSQKNPRMI